MSILLKHSLIVLAVGLTVRSVMAQRGNGPDRNRGPGIAASQRGVRFQEDRELFHFLLTNHQKISRSVKELKNGVETLTESDDPKVAARIRKHVEAMQYRVEENMPIRRRDPLFAELFRHADKIAMVRQSTKKGIRVTETSSDPYVARLIQAHARTISEFIAHGFAEAAKDHPIPEGVESQRPHYVHPVIAQYGPVVRLPTAAQQPLNGSKVVVDLTHDGEPGELNAGIEKVARLVNIYGGAGRESAEANIVVVLHGGATLLPLDADAYAERYGVEANPNLDCLRRLHEAGVKIFICGQALAVEGATVGEVVDFSEVAVSALSTLVNFQAKGYAYVPIGN